MSGSTAHHACRLGEGADVRILKLGITSKKKQEMVRDSCMHPFLPLTIHVESASTLIRLLSSIDAPVEVVDVPRMYQESGRA